jgi:hypothetical protein
MRVATLFKYLPLFVLATFLILRTAGTAVIA